MRSFTGILILTIAAASLVVSAQNRELRLVSTAWPPFTSPPGQPRYALDLVENAFGRIGVTAHTSIVEAAQFTTSLLEGAFDGSAAAWKDPQRDSALFFSQPYLENRLILVARKGDDVSATTLAGLTGKRVAIVEGYSYGETIDNSGPVFVRSRSEEDSLRMLLDGGVDYTLMDELVVQYILSNHASEAQSRLQLGARPLVTRQLYLALRRSLPDAQTIVNQFNAQLRGMIADRTYHRLLHVDWISADVDGDGIPESVPQSDQSGRLAPSSTYLLFSTDTGPGKQPGPVPQRFYIGGTTYESWAEVPARYKVEDPLHRDVSRFATPIFKFTF